MTRRSAYFVASIAAVVLLVAVPFGLAVGSALASPSTTTLSSALLGLPVLLELSTACAWVACVHLPLAWLSERFKRLRSVPLSAGVFALAFVVGFLGFYRAEPIPSRLASSAPYGLLVLLAYSLFASLANRLQPERPRHTMG